MSTPSDSDRQDAAAALEVARTVALEAAAMLRGAEDHVGTVRTKSNLRDLVTEWDTRAEELIRGRLDQLAPGVPILGEEGGASGPADGDRLWLVDPIDGTVNFAHGIPLFGVSIALEVGGEPVAGVVCAPALSWVFAASLGGGATFNGAPMHVSTTARLDQAMLATGFPYDMATTSHNFAEWAHFQRTAGACRRFGAASLDLCMVARGWLDGYWESRLSPWDLAAGALCVREAGGVVTGITGGPFASREGHAVASNGAIHEDILRELSRVSVP